MSNFQEFLQSLYKCLRLNDTNNSIIRKHHTDLEKVGDLSYSIHTVSLKSYDSSNSSIDTDELSQQSKSWKLQISHCVQVNEYIHIFLDRNTTFNRVIKQTLELGSKYGSGTIIFPNKFVVNDELRETDLCLLSLSHLRVALLKDVLQRCIEFNNCTYLNDNVVEILILQSNLRGKAIFCAGVTKSNVTANDFYKKRSIDMRLMAEHKYGLRISSDVGWQALIEKLGHSAVIIDLLQNHPSRTFTIHFDNPTNSSSKGAAFILYNCARLATLFKEFDRKVAAQQYPVLPLLEEIDLSLLTETEEWRLLYLYVLQFPLTVQDCIKDILEYKVNVHGLCSFLSAMCSVFSVYYRRIRILTEPREHLFSTLHARIFLLKAVQQVLHNGLYLLNIEPVNQM